MFDSTLRGGMWPRSLLAHKNQEERMPLINVQVFEDELSQEQSKDLIFKIMDAVTDELGHES